MKIHNDHFKPDEEDRVWLAAVGEQNWVVLTKDPRLRYRPLEIAALRASGARVFVVVAGSLRGSDIASVFVAALPAICRILYAEDGPFVARIRRAGR